MVLKIREVGNSMGVILPKEALAKLKVQSGDSLYLSETPDGFMITALDPDFGDTMKIAENVMRRYRNALRDLA